MAAIKARQSRKIAKPHSSQRSRAPGSWEQNLGTSPEQIGQKKLVRTGVGQLQELRAKPGLRREVCLPSMSPSINGPSRLPPPPTGRHFYLFSIIPSI